MKNLSRAYNRHKQQTKFKRRLDNWFARPLGNQIEEKQKAIKGEAYTFLKSTGNPCNCYDCSGMNKYKRQPMHEIIKEAQE